MDRLKEGIDNALVHDEEDVPNDIVRLNSKVTLGSGDGRSESIHMVSPSEENSQENKISVISTLGANLIGLAVDDMLQIGIQSDIRSLKITKIKRPHQLSFHSYPNINF